MPRQRKTNTNRRRLERVSIRAEARTEPDWDRFAWALLQHTKIISARQAATKQSRGKRAP